MMSAYDILLLIHILLFVYWLGGDLGVFYSSGFVVDGSLSDEARLTAAKIMLGCDLVPRICMALTLTVGGLLSSFIGIEHSSWQMLGIVLIGPLWLSMVLLLHFKHNAPFIPLLTKFDFYFRCLVIFGLISSSAFAFYSGRLADTPWVILKLVLFAFLVFCGLMIRINLSGFNASYVKIIQGTVTDTDNKTMRQSLNIVRPWVVTIWIVLVLQAIIGITKPELFF